MKRAAGLAAPLAPVVVVAVVCARHASDLGDALEHVDPWVFVACVALHLAVTPALREMLLSDLPVYALEACLLAMLLPLAAAHGVGLPGWTAALALVAPPASVLGLRLLHQRFEHHRLAAGVAVLGRPGLRSRLLLMATIVVSITFVRIWIALAAVGLPARPSDAAAAYVAVGLVGQLPLGPATGPAATLAIASGSGVGAAAAAGLVVSATSIVAVPAYLLCAAVIRPR